MPDTSTASVNNGPPHPCRWFVDHGKPLLEWRVEVHADLADYVGEQVRVTIRAPELMIGTGCVTSVEVKADRDPPVALSTIIGMDWFVGYDVANRRPLERREAGLLAIWLRT